MRQALRGIHNYLDETLDAMLTVLEMEADEITLTFTNDGAQNVDYNSSYFSLTLNGDKWCVWFDVDGEGTDPTIADPTLGTSVPVPIAKFNNGPQIAVIAGAIINAIEEFDVDVHAPDITISADSDLIIYEAKGGLPVIFIPEAIPRWASMTHYESKDLTFPMIEILPSETRSVYSAAQSPYNELAYMETHSIDIDVGIAGSDARSIQRNLLQYREAIRRVLINDPTCGGRFDGVQLSIARYSPILTAEKEKKMLKILSQMILVRMARN